MFSIYKDFGISKEVYDYGEEILKGLKDRFEEIDKTAEYNQLKVLKAMQEHKVAAECFNTSTGYGYDDVEYYRMIPVIDPASEAAVINFDGNDNTDVAVLVNEDIYVTVSSPDEREIRAVRFYDGHDFRGEEGPEGDGMFHTGLSFG